MRRLLILAATLAALTVAGCGHFFTDEADNGGTTTTHFAFFVNAPSGATGGISIFSIDSTNGALLAAGSVSTNTVSPQSAVVVLNKFLYVGSNGGGVSAFAINSNTGALTPISGSPVVAGNVPLAVSAAPNGKFLYVANQADNNVSGFTIDGSTGALAPINGMPVPLGGSPADIEVDALGRFVFVAIPGNSIGAGAAISTFRIDSNTGLLSGRQDFTPSVVGGQPTALVAEKTGKFLYVLDKLPGVEPFNIDPTSGALTAISLPASPPGSNPNAVTTDSSGSYLYVTNQASSNVSAYAIFIGGNLLNLTGSPFAASTSPQAIGVEPSGKFLYVAHASGSVLVYSLDPSTGTISQTSSSTGGTNPVSVAFE